MRNPLQLRTLGLAAMHSNALAAVGVMTFEQLLDVEVYELRKIPNLGAKGIDNILCLVASKGYRLKGQDLYDEAKSRKKAKRQWVGLSDEEYVHITDTVFHQGHGLVAYYLAIEAKLKEKNT
jgi:predicted aspartyl protease